MAGDLGEGYLRHHVEQEMPVEGSRFDLKKVYQNLEEAKSSKVYEYMLDAGRCLLDTPMNWIHEIMNGRSPAFRDTKNSSGL